MIQFEQAPEPFASVGPRRLGRGLAVDSQFPPSQSSGEISVPHTQ
jgi:hypothetical protein